MSFGHAAFFGLGAYGSALTIRWLGAPMEAALPAGLVLAALGAALIGAFVVRLSGIYLAMMTLAAAQILYAVAFQWVAVTGGDNGIVGDVALEPGSPGAAPITAHPGAYRSRPCWSSNR